MKLSYSNGLIQAVYDDRIKLAKAFVRIQEHYENPKFRGQIFTLGQLREWYSEFHGGWTYYTDWSGFNVPAEAVLPFVDGHFDPLSPEEQELVDAVRYHPHDFYLIGTYKGDKGTLYHEKMHALWYLNKQYKNMVQNYVDCVFNVEPVIAHLRDLGYHEHVLQDELQAYLGGSMRYLEENGFFEGNHLKDACLQLREMIRPYMKEIS